MRKFNKIISLVLVFVMAFALSAGAFTDDEKIENSQAVDTMVALGIIKGYTDGSFRPEATVTRAEMAKMIYVMRNGGNDDGAAYYKGISTGLNDVKGHWAEGYINYCFTLGIIAGNGDGTFRPDNSVTGLEAAKMILVCGGYTAEQAGLVGSQWNIRTAALATEKGLFEGFSAPIDSPAPRAFAVQMLYNALDTNMVTLSGSSFVDMVDRNGEEVTVGSKYLGLQSHTGVMLSSRETDGKGKVSVEGFDAFEWKDDLTALVGQQVKVLYKVTRGKASVYGLFATDKNNVIDVLKGDASWNSKTGKLEVNGKSYDVDADAAIYIDGSALKDTDFNAYFDGKTDACKVRFIDNDGDGDLDMARVTSFELTSVSYVSAKGFRTESGTFVKFTEFDSHKYDVYEGMKKGDTVVITVSPFNGKIKVEKAETVSGKITAIRSGEIRIDSDWHKVSAGLTVSMGKTYNFVLVNGIAVSASAVTESVSAELALLIKTSSTADLDDHYQARLVLSDGTAVSVLADSSVVSVKSFPALVTYKVNGDIYTVSEVGSGNLAGYDSYGTAKQFDSDTDLVGGYGVSDDATVFIAFGSKYSVISGKELMNIAGTYGTEVRFLRSTDGFGDIGAMLIIASSDLPGTATSEVFGFVTDINYTFDKNGKSYDNVSVWTASGAREINVSEGSVQKGDIITFKLTSDDFVSSMTKQNAETAAITAYSKATGRIAIDGAVKKLDSKATILFVDSTDLTGVEGGEILTAEKPENEYVANARIVYADSGKTTVLYVVFDVNNEWAK